VSIALIVDVAGTPLATRTVTMIVAVIRNARASSARECREQQSRTDRRQG
jgi:hypothetical protein